jgi:hypothetical protein
MSNFVFRGYTRRVARAVVESMVPHWPDFEVDMTDEVLAQVEATVRGYPPGIQLGVLAMLYGLEFGGPLTMTGFTPFSWLSRDEAEERLAKVAGHRVAQIRMMPMLLKIMVSFAAYSRPDVEAFLGVRRRAWRKDRQAFRRMLVAIDDHGGGPKVPEPLGGDPVVSPESYLEFAEARAASVHEAAASAEGGSA